MPVPSFHLGAQALAALGLLSAAPAWAGAVSFAEYLSGTVNVAHIGGFESRTADSSASMLTTDIGFAGASVHTAAGAMAGQAVVTMDATEFEGASLRARAEARNTELLHFGTDYCVSADCRSAASLGVTALSISFRVHASGGVSAFATNTQFDHAHASVSYQYGLTNSVGFTASGAGIQERGETGGVIGGIGSSEATLAVRPGETLELLMAMQVFAGASISGWRNSGFTAAHVLADADFVHTLLWDGITDITAFGADGQTIALAPGGRFQILGDSGHNYWFASPGFAATGGSVPEPATWALLLGGCLAGASVRRRRTPQAAD